MRKGKCTLCKKEIKGKVAYYKCHKYCDDFCFNRVKIKEGKKCRRRWR